MVNFFLFFLFFYMRCLAHIFNLIVKQGLEITGGNIEKIRESVAFWTLKPKRHEKSELAVHLLKDKVSCGKKIGLNCETWWNSPQIMHHFFLKYIVICIDTYIFVRFEQRKPRYKSLPTDQDWNLATEICDKLLLFFIVIELFTGTKCPTTHIFSIIIKNWIALYKILFLMMGFFSLEISSFQK